MHIENISIVLVNTRCPGNIGSVARAMKNMGLSQLILADSCCRIDEEAFRMATHADDILRNATQVSTFAQAVNDCSYIFGTTSRRRKKRTFLSPDKMGAKVIEMIPNNKVAIVFGPEDRGLTNRQLQMCHEVVSIPTARASDSLNIAQAVMVVCYEIFCASFVRISKESVELASTEELEAMYRHMRSALLEIGFLNPQNPDYVIGNFRRIFTRARLTPVEVKMIRGLFRQLLWYIKKK